MKPLSWVAVLLAITLATPGAAVHAADNVDETAVADALVLYEQGRFVEAHRAFEPPAAAGMASARYHLGLLYARGEGVAWFFALARNLQA